MVTWTMSGLLAALVIAGAGGDARSVSIPFERPTSEELAQLREKAPAAGIILQKGKRRSAVIVSLGEKPTGGYAIAITKVTLRGSILTVQAQVTEPGRGAMVTQAFTHPFDAVWMSTARLGRAGRRLALRLVDQSGKLIARS